MGSLKDDFIDQGMDLRETHISQVFLTRDTVYKVKKSVSLGFLDFTTLERRRLDCEAEVELNRRLAPTIYTAVVPIARDAQGVHRVNGRGEHVEWAVEMRRLADSDAASERLRAGRLSRGDVCLLAEHIARFHATARHDAQIERYGEVAQIEGNVRENFAQTRQSAAAHLDPKEIAAIEQWQLGFLQRHGARFAERAARGRIRDGHGDLRLEHCYLDDSGGVQIIDCIEFSDRFRYGDVCADLAFLSMDLDWHERHDLSEALLAAYACAADDYDLYGVVDFYESYRAYVRGKVSGMLEADLGADPEVRARAGREARKFYLLAEACTREPIAAPGVYAVGGVIASGKSTFAQALATRIGAPVVEADRVRKFLGGASPTTPFSDAAFSGHYDADTTARTYAELVRRADVVLASGRSVIVDASFRDREQRLAAMALARRHCVPFTFFECETPLSVCKERLALRALGPSISDGRAEVFDSFVASYQPVDELPAELHVRVDTSRPVAESLAQVENRLT
jgi:hypothetical protein